MISKALDVEEFVEEIKNKEYMDIIYLTEQEATAAERNYYRSSKEMDKCCESWKQYADSLKSFVSFMRYGVKPANIGIKELQLFSSVRRRLLSEENFHGSCLDLFNS